MGTPGRADADEATASTESSPAERPAVDLAMEAARARTEKALFGRAEPARFGRYVVFDRIAGGGMGIVYAAYDPELDRKVALKVLHPRRAGDVRSHQRLTVEARALAKLDHPNVVKVHDVITDAGQTVVVMELVDGKTLAAWEAAAPRTWREIVDVYVQAGAGLAAAHGVDVIHRDFKPANSIVGADGRVRVLDFGLARFAGGEVGDDAPTSPAGGEPAPGDDKLTATGDVVGTMSYSSPEQLAGEAVTAASDQFSYCVALHRAIEGVRPFPGTSPSELIAAMRAGTIRHAEDGRRVPSWLRAAIARGLAVDPAKRHPSMTALNAELGRPRGWRRWRVPAVVAALVGIAIAATAVIGARGAAAPTCDGGASDLRAVWDAQRRASIGGAIDAVGTPYANSIRDPLLGDLDGYATRWSGLHKDACVAHRRGASSDDLLDRQMACLRQRLGDLRAAVDVLAQTDAGSVANAMDVVARMPDVAVCADIERLRAEVAPPATEALRGRVEALRARISAAEALDRAGRSDAALAAATDALAEAQRTAYLPVEVDAALAQGKVLLGRGDTKAAAVSLSIAKRDALQSGMTAAGVEAAARLIYAEGMEDPDVTRLERDLGFVEPLSLSLQGDRFARPLLLNNVGAVYLAAGRREDAARYFGQAKDALHGVEPSDLELTVIDRNLALVTSDTAKREALARGVWERLQATLGPHHPRTLDDRQVYAEYIADPAMALTEISAVCADYGAYHPTLHKQRVFCEDERATLAVEVNDLDTAATAYTTEMAEAEGSTDDDVVVWRMLATGELALQRGDIARAIAVLSDVVTRRIHSEYWWQRREGLRAESGLGRAEIARGSYAEAERHLRTAVDGLAALASLSEQVETQRRLASAQHLLAGALRKRGATEPADALDADAMAFYRAASPTAYRWILEPIR